MDKNFNIVIAGVGGQGVITLVQLIAEAAFAEGYDVKTSELHGLSQRGGSVETHVRFGKKVWSPLISEGEADLIISLELAETLRKLRYANKNTKFVINGYFFPYPEGLSEEEITGIIGREIKQEKRIVPASKVCQEKLEKEVVSTSYLLGYCVSNELIPLKKESVLKAMENLFPEKYLELNKKAFELVWEN
ncbi:MAG: hypothetical protein A2365_02165 [Candidatus Nealsonbacteria bacterium RIFOXYB1_FULL_40_15]|uniref:Pyruvate/ketoisovalerate oxidoreductase catalytic domain-containing protein n=2 Tax=Candidatus Nealsoniibacteriota TaxID=1817911 RepID=A0A1G2ETE1_9BACT|nr:MAG: hypothetical protein A2365_02165 [Candidatus Nealsonbacteria bacterium RIFOXYB1_FULL_40_15]OGZ28461.1 MAG: hypothetical protein A2562_03245 [Candidatus Nealsonbacteria bacterium RIFOXYD1_FULL_39_11]OGZ28651.1 MAG: hypothetical protein A2427_04550 [Candidatus Nealsonbacteria bacterium RIFOXYC1_FULL_40_7]